MVNKSEEKSSKLCQSHFSTLAADKVGKHKEEEDYLENEPSTRSDQTPIVGIILPSFIVCLLISVRHHPPA